MLIKQFRYQSMHMCYEFRQLVEPGEEMAQAGIREIYEETGLVFEPKVTEGAYTRPFFTTVGMTDESCGTIYGYCSGTPTNEHEEESEDIEIVLAEPWKNGKSNLKGRKCSNYVCIHAYALYSYQRRSAGILDEQ